MIFFKYIIQLSFLLFWSLLSGAQDSQYVYQDPTMPDGDTVQVRTVENNANVGLEEIGRGGLLADTVLRNNFLAIDPDSVKALKNLKSFEYAKNLDSLLIAYQQSQEKEEAGSNNRGSWLNSFLSSAITKYFFWTLALVFVGLILYKLFFTEGVFLRNYGTGNVRVVEDETDPLSKTTDFGKLILDAVNSGNYRVAVRYHYLQSLQKLSQKGAILVAADKTNHQYVKELSGKPYKNSFAALTLQYEYVWYGEFEIDGNVFNIIQNKFKQFNSGI